MNRHMFTQWECDQGGETNLRVASDALEFESANAPNLDGHLPGGEELAQG